MNDKIPYLEYIIQRLIEWYKEVNPNGSPEKGIDKLKVFKMVFFIATANSNEDNNDLLELFNDFRAMPYGPVELDLYNHLNEMTHFHIEREMQIRDNTPVNVEDLEQCLIQMIDNSIITLRNIDNEFILKPSFELVNISHKWFSWKYTYNNNPNNNAPMPADLIKYDTKYYN